MRAVLLALLLPAILQAQKSSLPLNFNSYAIKLCVAKDESLVLTTRAGEVGGSASIQGNWHRMDSSFGNKLLPGFTVDQSDFYNKDTGFISGFINNPANDKYDIIYHTTNGGAKWTAVDFGQDGWIDDATHLDNGEAWLSVAGSGIAYTRDYCASWKKFRIPNVKQRFAAIYFNDRREGIIGSLWNMIAWTNNNCQDWKQLATPLDQKKYNKTNQKSRPEINRVALYKDYFLVQQEGLVFYSRRDSINWVWMPQYADFYTDPYNSALFFRTIKGNFVRSDSNLAPAHVFEQKLSCYDAKCRNGSLFIVSGHDMIQLNERNENVSIPFKNTAATGAKPVGIGYVDMGEMGVQDNKVFCRKGLEGPWKYLFTFPLSLESGGLAVVNKQELLYGTADSLLYFDLSGKLRKAVSKDGLLNDFTRSGINKVVFISGSSGCYHYVEDRVEYTNTGSEFGNAVERSRDKNGKSTLPEYEATIASADVTSLINKLPDIFAGTQFATIQDLAFTEKEYEQCKKDIAAFRDYLQQPKKNKNAQEPDFSFHINNLDFNRLISLVDSVRSIDNEQLNNYLCNLDGMWSTTRSWKSICLINNDKEELTIRNNFYDENPFCFPWTISVNGYGALSLDMAINRFINKVYPSFLNKEGRVKVLHALVKKMYEQSGH